MNFGVNSIMGQISNIILYGKNTAMSDRDFYELEIGRWRASPRRILQIKGQLYYEGEHDITRRKRTMIGEDGKPQVVENLPNNRIIDNQYGKRSEERRVGKECM